MSYSDKSAKIISIEGNIGSGKSTLVEELRKKFGNNKKVCFLQEPVDIWNTIKDKDGNTMIAKFYADTKKYSFAFQMMAYISRLSILKAELKKDYDIIFTERCLLTDRNVFAKMLHDDGKIVQVEYQIYNKWFDEFIRDFPKIEYIYLKTCPQIAFDRIIKRGRAGENIPLEYLQTCHGYHENWLEKHEKLIINCDDDVIDNPDIFTEWINKVDAITHIYKLTFDGASKGNPGKCGAGFVIWKNKEILYKGKKFLSNKNTNNFAEYSAVILGLQKCIELKLKNIHVYGDSQLVIKQINNEYKVESENLKVLYETVIDSLIEFDEFSFRHIMRQDNKEADALANEALSDRQLEEELTSVH